MMYICLGCAKIYTSSQLKENNGKCSECKTDLFKVCNSSEELIEIIEKLIDQSTKSLNIKIQSKIK